MRYINTFESFNEETNLIIIDVQKSFDKFFTKNYLSELNKYAKTFTSVYQIWDNHIDGKDVDNDYLYDEDPDIPVHHDLYIFANQKDLIEKRYNYDVDVDFYKKILDPEVYKDAKEKESKGLLKQGNYFKTKGDTYIVYIGNNHIWFHIPKKLYDIFLTLKGKDIIIVGGSDQECFLDVEVAAKIFGVNVKRDFKYIYSATYCPIK